MLIYQRVKTSILRFRNGSWPWTSWRLGALRSLGDAQRSLAPGPPGRLRSCSRKRKISLRLGAGRIWIWEMGNIYIYTHIILGFFWIWILGLGLNMETNHFFLGSCMLLLSIPKWTILAKEVEVWLCIGCATMPTNFKGVQDCSRILKWSAWMHWISTNFVYVGLVQLDFASWMKVFFPKWWD